MTIGNLLAILISLAALYLAVAFVKAKMFRLDQWPFTADELD